MAPELKEAHMGGKDMKPVKISQTKKGEKMERGRVVLTSEDKKGGDRTIPALR